MKFIKFLKIILNIFIYIAIFINFSILLICILGARFNLPGFAEIFTNFFIFITLFRINSEMALVVIQIKDIRLKIDNILMDNYLNLTINKTHQKVAVAMRHYAYYLMNWENTVNNAFDDRNLEVVVQCLYDLYAFKSEYAALLLLLEN